VQSSEGKEELVKEFDAEVTSCKENCQHYYEYNKIPRVAGWGILKKESSESGCKRNEKRIADIAE